MANVKISQLPAGSTPLTGSEIIPLVQSGVTSNVSLNSLLTTFSISPIFTQGVIIKPNGSQQFADMTIQGVRSWLWQYSHQNFGSGSTTYALELTSDLPAGLPLYWTQYGFLYLGNIISAYPSLNGGMSDTTGPALGITGDLLAGDLGYFGSGNFQTITAVGTQSGLIQISITSDPTGYLANGKVIVVGGLPSNSNANGYWTIGNYTAGTPITFTLTASTPGTQYASTTGWYGIGADIQVVGRRYAGYVPSATVIGCNFNLADGSTGQGGVQQAGAYMTFWPDSNLSKITGFDGQPSPGSAALVTYSGLNPSTPSYFSILGRTSNGTASEWVRFTQGAMNFTTALTTTPPNGIGLEQTGVVALSAASQLWNIISGAIVTATGPTAFYPNTNRGASLGVGGGSPQAWSALFLGGSTSGYSEIIAPATAGSGVWTLQNASDTFVGRATTDILTNKTLSGLTATAPSTKTSSTYSMAATDVSLIINFAGTHTLTLLSASSVSGQMLLVRTITANAVVSASSNVIPLVGGSAGTAILAATAGKWALLQSDGTNWQIMAGN